MRFRTEEMVSKNLRPNDEMMIPVQERDAREKKTTDLQYTVFGVNESVAVCIAPACNVSLNMIHDSRHEIE